MILFFHGLKITAGIEDVYLFVFELEDFRGLDKISKSLSNLSIFNRYVAVVNKIIGKDP